MMNPEKGFQAHAWVEYEGQILIGALSTQDFQPLLRLESQAKALPKVL